MLVIRKEQRSILAAPCQAPFLAAASNALATLFPDDQRLGRRDEVDSLVSSAVNDAAAFGITGVRELLLYVFLVFEQGRDFAAAHGWIGSTLRDAGLPGSAKMDLIYARLAGRAQGTAG